MAKPFRLNMRRERGRRKAKATAVNPHSNIDAMYISFIHLHKTLKTHFQIDNPPFVRFSNKAAI